MRPRRERERGGGGVVLELVVKRRFLLFVLSENTETNIYIICEPSQILHQQLIDHPGRSDTEHSSTETKAASIRAHGCSSARARLTNVVSYQQSPPPPPIPSSYYRKLHSSSTRDYLWGNTHLTGNKRSFDDAITGATRGWALKNGGV